MARHAEPRRQPIRSFLRQVPRPVALGVSTVLAGSALTGGVMSVTSWPFGEEPAARTELVEALQQSPAARPPERASRNRTAAPPPAPPTPTAKVSPSARPSPSTPAVIGQRWVTERVNLRAAPSTSADALGKLEALTRVGITAAVRAGWTQVVTGKRVGWVKSSYLSASKPTPKPKPAPPGLSDAPCSISSDIETHLTANARAVYRSVCAAFGKQVSSFGGYRAGDSGDHGSGRAVDIMISGDPGWDIARFVQAHARELKVAYVIYQQKIWMAGDPVSQWKGMEDRGSKTANHYDHVHVSVT